MLTLGLMEGVLSATLGILVLMILANENAPLHRIFGPLVAGPAGLVAYLIHDSGRVDRAADVVGLAFFVVVVFFVPLGLMRAAWKAGKVAAKPAPAAVVPGSAHLRPVEAPRTIPERRVA